MQNLNSEKILNNTCLNKYAWIQDVAWNEIQKDLNDIKQTTE